MHKSSIKSLVIWLALISTASVHAQKHTTWMELPKKDAEKLLNESPWSHTQVDTDVSEMFYSPTKAGNASAARSTATTAGQTGDQQSVNNNRADRGAVNQ